MAAVLSPPQLIRPLHPRPAGRDRAPLRLVRDEQRHSRGASPRLSPVPEPGPVTTARPVAAAATFRRRRLVAMVLLIGLAFTIQSTATSLIGAVWADQAVPGGTPAAQVVAPLEVPGPAGSRHEYVVQPGDSLWTIAERLQPAGDIRPLVDALSERAGSSSVRVGQRIDLDGLGL